MESSVFPIFGATLTIHPDLVVYIDMLHEYQIRKSYVQSKIYSDAAQGKSEEEICTSVKFLVEEDVKKLILELSKNGIYSKTVGDFLPSDYFDSILASYQTGVAQDTQKTTQEYYEALTSAREAADNSVTGLPFGIISNSVIGITAYALQERSEIKKQQAQANTTFFLRSQRLENTYKEIVESTKNNHRTRFISNIDNATVAIYDSMAASHLAELAYCGKFDTSALNDISIHRSSELLQNISIVESKAKLLQQALILCPFNPQIYAKAAEVGLFNKQLCDLANFLHISENVIQMIEYTSKFESKQNLLPAEIVDQCKSSCAAISMISGEPSEKIFQRYFPGMPDRIKQLFQCFFPFLCAQESTKSFRLQRFATMYEGQLNQYRDNHDCFEFVQNCTCSEKDIQCLIKYFGYTEIESEIATVTKYTGNPKYFDIIRYMAESVEPFLSKALSYADGEQRKQRDAALAKEKSEAAEKARQEKQYARSKKLTNIACIAIIIGIIFTILGCFWVPFSVVGLSGIITFACITIYLKFFDTYGWSS